MRITFLGFVSDVPTPSRLPGWLLWTVFCCSCNAQDPLPVSFEMAFTEQGPELVLPIASPDGWLDDDHFVLAEGSEDELRLVVVHAETGRREPYSKPLSGKEKYGASFQTAPDRTGETWVEEGRLYYRRLDSDPITPLTEEGASVRNPRFSPDGRWLAYTKEKDLYSYHLATQKEYRLTRGGSDTIYNGYASWVYFEEILGRSSNYCAFWWSPDSGRLVYMQFDDSPVSTFPIYHQEGNYGRLEVTRYPKAGETNPHVKMGVVAAAGGNTIWLDFDPREDAYLAWPFWYPDSRRLHVQWLNRHQDHLVIFEADSETGKKRPIYEERQDSWVEFFEDITYLQNGEGFLLRSDKDGWRHLYLHAMDGSPTARLTSGPWSVQAILAVDEAGNKVYFSAKKEDMAGLDLMVVNLDGTGMKKLTRTGGTHAVSLSPDYRYFLDECSDYWTPPQLNLHRIDGSLVRKLADSANKEARPYSRAKLETFRIPSGDGFQLPAWWIVPKDLEHRGADKKLAVILRIYSGPNASRVRNRYQWTWRDFYYAEQGVITMCVDHRGSGQFGKKGVAYMHRKLGQWELHDLIEAVKWLRKKPFIDAGRIGITGHSYGGYMTLMAMTKGAEFFTHGIAGAPVTDWALYDTVYTERYMKRPQDNVEGYREASILTHAHLLKGPLRLIHGSVDDNVHLQNSLQLIQIWTDRAIPFELMIYPGSRHRIRQKQHRQDGENRFWFRHFLNRPFAGQPRADLDSL